MFYLFFFFCLIFSSPLANASVCLLGILLFERVYLEHKETPLNFILYKDNEQGDNKVKNNDMF